MLTLATCELVANLSEETEETYLVGVISRALRFSHYSPGMHLRSFRNEVEAHSRVVQFCSDLKRPRDYKSGSPQKGSEELQSPFVRGRRRNMKTSTKDRMKGSFHEVKGTIKEEIGKAMSDRNLKAEGKAEKKAGKVQQRIGDAKEAVANLKGQLAELKKTG